MRGAIDRNRCGAGMDGAATKSSNARAAAEEVALGSLPSMASGRFSPRPAPPPHRSRQRRTRRRS